MENIKEKLLKDFEKEFGDEKTYCCCDREYCFPGDQNVEIIEPLKSFLSSAITMAYEKGRAEEHKFFLNILDGIDRADEEMKNPYGGTKAIRFALQNRWIKE